MCRTEKSSRVISLYSRERSRKNSHFQTRRLPVFEWVVVHEGAGGEGDRSIVLRIGKDVDTRELLERLIKDVICKRQRDDRLISNVYYGGSACAVISHPCAPVVRRAAPCPRKIAVHQSVKRILTRPL